MDLLDIISRNWKILEEENKELQIILHRQELAMENARDQIDNGYQRARDYNEQVPFGFWVQPVQPNSQKRM
ncbi:hypothetical protein SLE2022_031430 [Rubroshorea leprosula]